ncbi:MAG TPA: VTT domain-containing protein [Terriglobales bacterium]|nr:VTT domain-containing protein [Terriglobales bacterium]
MHPLANLARHGYLALALVVFLESIGLPVPAALALIAAGTAAVSHAIAARYALPLALGATLAGDLLLYLAGRLSGWWLLGVLCRVSLNPESCILKSAQRFHRRGKLTLVVAKFIPGINTMAPPMAGSMRMPFLRFLQYDLAGAAAYVGAYFAVGYAFAGVIDVVYRKTMGLTRAVEWLAVAALAAYILYRFLLYWKHRRADVAPRITVHALADLQRNEPQKILIGDVRSHGYYDRGAQRIAGSVRLEPSKLLVGEEQLPRDRELYLYCT